MSSSHSTPRSLSHWLVRGFALVASLAAPAVFAGFHVSGTQLLDANNNAFVLRGVNEPHDWYPSQTQTAVNNIAIAGNGPGRCNVIRFVCSTGDQWTKTSASDLSNLINWAKAQNMIAVLEVHDCTGWPDKPAAVNISVAANYWASMATALQGTENYAIINIANEPFGNQATAADYLNDTEAAIATIRSAGITHTLMVDGANYGQDNSATMYNNAQAIFNSDPQHNVVFSVHMYQVYQSFSAIDSYLSKFLALNLPLVVGEFGNSNGARNPVDWQDVMERCVHYNIGYMGWSWSGNSKAYAALDMVTNFAFPLTSWGQGVFNGPNGTAYGISETAVKCTVFP